MYRGKRIAVIIPVLDEEEALPLLFPSIPEYVDRIIAADNGSTDRSPVILQAMAAEYPLTVCREEERGYGAACLRAMEELGDADVVVFLDADGSDDPQGLPLLLDPIVSGGCDFVVSNRFSPELERGAMGPVQRFGNKFSVFLVRLFWGFRYHDLGPFRAVTAEALGRMRMRDRNYGWTVEMQIRAVQLGLSISQPRVAYRNRQAGRSKVSGSLRGILGAGFKILWKVFLFRVRRKPE